MVYPTDRVRIDDMLHGLTLRNIVTVKALELQHRFLYPMGGIVTVTGGRQWLGTGW